MKEIDNEKIYTLLNTEPSLSDVSQNDSTSSKIKSSTKAKLSKRWTWSIGSIIISLFIGWMVLLAIGANPVEYFQGFWKGNFGSGISASNLIAQMSYLIPLGLAMIISFRAGVFNLGSAGQFLIGGLAGYFFASKIDIGRVGIIFTIIIPMLAASIVAYAIAKLKTTFGINIVISSILINWIIFYLFKLLTNPAYVADWYAVSSMIPIIVTNSLDATWISNLMPGTSLGWGIFLAGFALIITIVIYKWTTWGVKQDIVGENQDVSKYMGDNSDKLITRAMIWSGALSGLAAAIYYFGLQTGIQQVGNDLPVMAFNGITLALISYNSPFGILFASLLVGSMYNAQPIIYAYSGVSGYLSDLILAVIIFVLSLTNLFIIYRPQDKLKIWMNNPSNAKLLRNNRHLDNDYRVVIVDDDSEEAELIISKDSKGMNSRKTTEQATRQGGDR